MHGQDERRAHRRLDITLPLDCASADPDQEFACRAVTRNIGSGGVCFETSAEGFMCGSAWKLALTVPPGEGHFPYTGQVQGLAEVLRVDQLPANDATGLGERRFAVAARFREPLKLRFQDP